ncbi:MAG: hypothetical protein KGM99_09250 [Burkholderiales bacterium]|nr:hypothetical protein [Burkholderiales bacterium]
MNQPETSKKSQSVSDEGSPKFGRLLIVLFLAVSLIVIITFATEAYYTN